MVGVDFFILGHTYISEVFLLQKVGLFPFFLEKSLKIQVVVVGYAWIYAWIYGWIWLDG